jgi:hypothetical protein
MHVWNARVVGPDGGEQPRIGCSFRHQGARLRLQRAMDSQDGWRPGEREIVRRGVRIERDSARRRRLMPNDLSSRLGHARGRCIAGEKAAKRAVRRMWRLALL